MRLGEYLDQMCWSQADLARAAKVSPSSVQRAIKGGRLSRRTAAAILKAIGKELNQTVRLEDVTDMRIAPYKGQRKPKSGSQASTQPVKTGKPGSQP